MKNKGYAKFWGANKVHKEDVQVAHTTFNKYVRVRNFKLTQEFTKMYCFSFPIIFHKIFLIFLIFSISQEAGQ